jgi:hypothetical protein
MVVIIPLKRPVFSASNPFPSSQELFLQRCLFLKQAGWRIASAEGAPTSGWSEQTASESTDLGSLPLPLEPLVLEPLPLVPPPAEESPAPESAIPAKVRAEFQPVPICHRKALSPPRNGRCRAVQSPAR